jgi:hypothetical protein
MKTDTRFAILIAVMPLVVVAALLFACGSAGSTSIGVAAGRALDFNQYVLSAGQGPGSIAIADVNHDGKLDIIVANSTDGTLSALLGDGKGHFTPAAGSPFACGKSPNDIAAGDFNGDGNLDLVIANTETPYLTILLGDGKGGFAPSPQSPFDTHSYPHVHGVAVADFNGDGKLDAVTDNWGHDQILMFLGGGKGNLILPGQAFKTGKRPYERLRSADFNKDGNPDVVTTDLDQNAVSILLGDGKGGFRKMPGSPFSLVGCEGPDRVATGDINGDGLRDIVVTCAQNNKLMLYLGSHDGSFTISARSVQTGWAGVAVADLEGRGKDDIVVSNSVLDNQPKPANGTITILSSK